MQPGPGAQRQRKPPTEAVFFRPGGVFGIFWRLLVSKSAGTAGTNRKN